MLYPQSLTDAKIIVKYKTEKDNATFFNDSKEVSLTGEWTNGQSIRYIPVSYTHLNTTACG